MRTIREYLRVLLPLMATLGLYQFFAVPFIEPKAETKSRPPLETASHSQEVYWWSKYFGPNDWQNQNPAILKTKNGILLFKNSEKLTPDSLKLKPLTIILPRGKGDILGDRVPEGEVLFVNNPEGAQITFRDTIDLTNSEGNRVKDGTLHGPIEIIGPSNQTGKTDLWVETRDVSIDHKHLWTLHDIKMRLGTNYIEGRDLSIYLDRSLDLKSQGNGLAESSPFHGLDRLELLYLRRAEFDLQRGGIWSPKNIPTKLPATASLLCNGSFHFDFHALKAELTNNVKIVHTVQGQVPDEFSCDELRVRFGFPEPSANKEQALSSPSKDGWAIEHIEAFGKLNGDNTRSDYWVEMRSPGMKTRTQGRFLELDLVRGRMALSNRLNTDKKLERSPAFIEHQGLRVWSPSIEFENADLISLAPRKETSHLGSLWAEGSGKAQWTTEDNDEWKLSWTKQLIVQPDADQDRVTIDGNANASSMRQGRFSAELLDLWLFQISPDMQKRMAMLYPGKKPQSIYVDRMHARGQVFFDSPQLRAQVEEGSIWLKYPDLDRLQSIVPESPNQGIQLNAPSGLAQTAPIAQPHQPAMPMPLGLDPSTLARGSGSENQASNALGAMDSRSLTAPLGVQGPGKLAGFPDNPKALVPPETRVASPTSMPLSVTGSVLRSRVLVQANKVTIDDLEIDGNVTLIRDQITDQATLPLTMTGEKLKLNTSEQGMMDAQIVGAADTPATIRLGSGSLQGLEIRFNQRSQQVWMDHPGVLVLPTEILARSNTPGQAKNIQWISRPVIEWKGSMIFDGRVARMMGGVHLSGDLLSDPESRWVIVGDAEVLEAHLTRPLEMGNPNSGPTEIDRIVLKNNVDIRASQTDPGGRFEKSRERLSLPEMTIDLVQQNLLGQGPGWIRSRRPAPASNGMQKAGLQCLHLTFSGMMRGNFLKGDVEFVDRIEALLGPIQSWDETLDVNQLQQLSIDQSLLTCDRLKIYSTADLSWNRVPASPGAPTPWELVATGRVKVDSLNNAGSLTVTAPEIAFDGMRELLRIKGTPPREAAVITLLTNKQPNAPKTLVVSSMELNSRTLEPTNMMLIDFSTAPSPNGTPLASPTTLEGMRSGSGPLPSPREFPNRPR